MTITEGGDCIPNPILLVTTIGVGLALANSRKPRIIKHANSPEILSKISA